jgi:Cof subfamily protein (haloacid dehalogenase superfamily)
MRTLYVSDLDGTLLNADRELSQLTVDTINGFIAQGGLFTIATARMAYGCDYKLERIKLNLPGIVMNGACLYSFDEHRYSEVQTMETAKVKAIESILDEYEGAAFMYTYADNALSIFYKTEMEDQDTQYLSPRALRACREVRKVSSFYDAAETRQVIYFALTGTRERMQSILDKLRFIAGIQAVSYLNIYNGLYFLEIFDAKANKANALKKLQLLVRTDEVVAFGDNLNDIEMMRAADFRFAPENAVDEVKKMADKIIESHDRDGVAKYLCQKYML